MGGNRAGRSWVRASTSQKLTGTAVDAKAITSWGAPVALLANDVGLATTLTPHWVTLAAEGALRITAAGCKPEETP